jgi:anaerobic magnesium-protoporphyrin IX monomethyl ester cyclase
MNEITLLQSFSDDKLLLNDRGYTPLNLIWIGNCLKKNNYQLKILDNQKYNADEIADNIDGKIVGINYTILSTNQLDFFSKIAKEKGAYVVIGGQAATASAKQLLTNKNIDFVIKYDGEEAMLRLADYVLKGIGKLKDIPNLVYRDGSQIIENPIKSVPVNESADSNRDINGIDMDWYIQNFTSDGYPELSNHFVRATNSFSHKGCPRRSHNKGCSFCARIDNKLNSRAALKTYKEYKHLRDNFGINYIFDDSDSWIRLPWLKELNNHYENFGNLNVGLRVYGDIRDIKPDSAALMKKLNVKSVLIGIESGCEKTLFENGKPMQRGQILSAIRMLARHDIEVCTAYVLGLLGETEKSLEKTYSISQEIAGIGNLKVNYWNIVMPLPGSPIWSKMMTIPELKQKYSEHYKFNIDELRKDYVENLCNLGNNAIQTLNDFYQHIMASENQPIREYIR